MRSMRLVAAFSVLILASGTGCGRPTGTGTVSQVLVPVAVPGVAPARAPAATPAAAPGEFPPPAAREPGPSAADLGGRAGAGGLGQGNVSLQDGAPAGDTPLRADPPAEPALRAER